MPPHAVSMALSLAAGIIVEGVIAGLGPQEIGRQASRLRLSRLLLLKHHEPYIGTAAHEQKALSWFVGPVLLILLSLPAAST